MATKKRRRMTNAEKKERAEIKKRLQEEGVLPPDKPRLDRKRFLEEAKKEWNSREPGGLAWEFYLAEAISIMLAKTEGCSRRVSLEAVGAAKVLKLAVRLQEFSRMLEEKGKKKYRLMDKYEYIRDIFDA